MANWNLILVFGWALILMRPISISAQSCHGGGSPVGGATTPVSSPGIPAAAVCQEPDTSKFSVSIYGNLNGSLSPDGRRGDPLGTGARSPSSTILTYARNSRPNRLPRSNGICGSSIWISATSRSGDLACCTPKPGSSCGTASTPALDYCPAGNPQLPVLVFLSAGKGSFDATNRK